jgi:adenylate cyclase
MPSPERRISRHLRDIIAYASICAGVIAIVTALTVLRVFDRAEQTLHDLRFRIRGVEDTSGSIVVVAIDPQTLEMLGLTGMPPRDHHAPLIENLYRAGAKAVMFDVEFFGYRGEIDPETLGPGPSSSDSLFAAAIAAYPNTVIARKMAKTVDEATGQSAGESPLPPPLFQHPDQLAFVDMIQDSDSVVRRARLISNDTASTGHGWEYSFALRAAMFAMDADTAWVDEAHHRAYVGDAVIPLDSSNPPAMIINYATDEQTFASKGGYISYEQVMDIGEFGIQALIAAGRFTGKVVLIGATFPESHDTKMTPFYLGTELFSMSEYPMYGVNVHKSIAETIIDRRFILPVRTPGLICLIVVMGVLATLINYRFRGYGGLALSIVLMLGYAALAVLLFIRARFMIPVAAPAFATVTFDYIGVVTYNFLAERRQKAMIRGAFSQYVPSSVVNDLLKNPEKLTLGGEERVMSVLFSDVAGFTTISEQLTPTELVVLLNEYLTAMTDVVFRYNGIIDKYEGDAIMAEFGAPLPDERHALNACLAALDMQTELARLREKFTREGRPILFARAGINSGRMVIGNMGSSKIFDYTVMGDNVNLSSRLEGANKAYKTAIMCSEATRVMAGDVIITRELDLLRVKGKTAGVLVHEILAKKDDGLTPERQRLVDTYLEGLAAYKNRRWEEGCRLFARALEIDPADGPSEVYLERCRSFRENPPADDWDGIYTMRTK